MSDALNNLPPEMQARLAQIMAGQQQQAPAQPTQAPEPPPAPIVKPPSLMDHVIALRQEVAALRQEAAAQSNVIDAVGQAVGQLYQMFQPSSGANAQGQTYSQAFQQNVEANETDF
mgnify:CR=1 FL=1